MRKQIYLLVCLLVALSLSACQNVSRSAEPQAIVQEDAQPQVSTETPADTEEATDTDESSETPTVEETVQPLNLSDYDLQYEQQEEFIKIYEQIQPVEQADIFEGIWNRTDVASSLGAELTITEQTKEGFTFAGDFWYYSHSGWMEGNAKFAAPNVAVYEYINEWDGEDTTSEYLVFEKTTEGMKLYASAASADLGFGMHVFADGSYVQGEPFYTNATVLDDNFTHEVQEQLQNLLGEDYETYFKTVVEMGILSSMPATLEDGRIATYYDAFVPTMGGYAFELLVCEDGEIYFNSEADEIGLKTNAEGAIDYPAHMLVEE